MLKMETAPGRPVSTENYHYAINNYNNHIELIPCILDI